MHAATPKGLQFCWRPLPAGYAKVDFGCASVGSTPTSAKSQRHVGTTVSFGRGEARRRRPSLALAVASLRGFRSKAKAFSRARLGAQRNIGSG
jgi:hypothetical protein